LRTAVTKRGTMWVEKKLVGDAAGLVLSPGH